VTALRRYYRGRKLVTMRDVAAGQNYVYQFDHQGTTQCLTDQTGAVTDRFASDAWGVQVKRTGTSINRHWYIGNWGYRRAVDRALDYVRARYYTMARGRWASEDPAQWTLLGYRYARNSPSIDLDPSGLFCAPRGCTGKVQVRVDVVDSYKIVDLACGPKRDQMCVARGITLRFVILKLAVQDADHCGIVQWVTAKCKFNNQDCTSDTGCRQHVNIGNLPLTVDSETAVLYYSNVSPGLDQGNRYFQLQDQTGFPSCGDRGSVKGTWQLYTDVVDKDCIDAQNMSCAQWAKIGPNDPRYRNCWKFGYPWTAEITYDDRKPRAPQNPDIKGQPAVTKILPQCL
jgi:RHS repeat-associated protein